MEIKPQRDVFIEGLCQKMHDDESIFFVCADFGSPKLDALRSQFPERFINVGIAEQNLINVCTGLGLEGFKVYAYAIANFITMRCYEQTRINLALLSQLRPLNVNLIGVGVGYSYDMSGPSHQCLEDISIMRTLANIDVFSPADWVCAQALVDYSLSSATPKYLRFDSKPLEKIYENPSQISIEQGFTELQKGEDICLLSTGYMTQKANSIAKKLLEENIAVSVVDMFSFQNFNEAKLKEILSSYSHLITLEEGFLNKGGLDTLINGFINRHNIPIEIESMGVKDQYIFDIGDREFLHRKNQCGTEDIIKKIKSY
jgi:transketolase